METEELKRKLLGLWEKTTHNSKELLSVLFDYYFDIRYLEYKENDGKVVSAICGIPYTFGSGKNRLQGLYLIVLSSEEGFKRKGILSELLESFNQRVKDEFDFTFLVPHSDLMADYFGTQGYFSSFFILEERFTPLHDFKNDYLLSLTDSNERIRQLKTALLDEINVETYDKFSTEEKEEIIKFIKGIEKTPNPSVNLCHDNKDIEYLLSEDSIRKLKIHVAKDSENKITGIAFSQKEELKRIRVVAAYVSDICSYFALLDFIKREFDEFSLSINTYDSKLQIHSLIQQTYASRNSAGGDLDNTISTIEIPFNLNRLLQPMGMVRLLRFDHIIEYVAKVRSDADFKLLIKDYSSNSNSKIEEDITSKPVFFVKNGNCNIESLDLHRNDRSLLVLSKKEVSELLLRKNDSSNLIMEAFGIPRLDLQMRLLPC